jgi:hypothetical protein
MSMNPCVSGNAVPIPKAASDEAAPPTTESTTGDRNEYEYADEGTRRGNRRDVGADGWTTKLTSADPSSL